MNTLNRRILAAECSMKIMELLIKSDEQNQDGIFIPEKERK